MSAEPHTVLTARMPPPPVVRRAMSCGYLTAFTTSRPLAAACCRPTTRTSLSWLVCWPSSSRSICRPIRVIRNHRRPLSSAMLGTSICTRSSRRYSICKPKRRRRSRRRRFKRRLTCSPVGERIGLSLHKQRFGL